MNENNFLILLKKALENEEEWVNFNDEETEIQLEMSDLIFNMLISEFSDDLTLIQKKRTKQSYFEI